MNRNPRLACLIVISACFALSSNADEPAKRGEIAFFENKIRPVLAEHCYECHSADADELGGNLLLDHREAMQSGGESGPVLVAGEPANSLIIQALRQDGIEMPPSGPLPESVISDFETWIKAGAADPRTPPKLAEPSETKAAATPVETLWSLQPVSRPAPPDVRNTNWPLSEIDRFVLARIETADLSPTEPADARTLVRRLHFDLIGLPPTLDEIEAFVAAAEVDRAGAIERLVDDLLSRPQYGERWGRYWLDVARFGESNGNDGLGRNPTFPHAWRYRDYVIEALNNDLPYDRFLTEQIAGDLLPADSPEQSDRQKIATGFLALASKPAKAMNNNFDMDVVADQIDAIGLGVMGFSVGCARCHDHKFDPIPTNDYYALAGIFTSTETMWGVAGNEKLTAPPTDLHVLTAAAKSLPPQDFVEDVVLRESDTGKPKAIPKSKWTPGTPLAMGVRDRAKPADCKVNIKGDAKKLGTVIPRGFLSAIEFDPSTSAAIADGKSGRRELAAWLTDPAHPLTARVITNRVWLHLFGEGIVRTPDDFGVYGERPTHPLLLDHLASRLIDNGWSIKQLIREIVLSQTYQLSSHGSPSLYDADAENRLLTRHQRRRLDAEALRDRVLAASGQLDRSAGQGSIIQHRDILVNLAGNLHQPSNQRSVYLCFLRSSPPPELAPFDLPDFTVVTGKRNISTVPAQSLYLLNSPFLIEQSQALGHMLHSAGGDQDSRIRQAYLQTLQREPTDRELSAAQQLVRSNSTDLNDEVAAWASLGQALLMTNEFRYVD